MKMALGGFHGFKVRDRAPSVARTFAGDRLPGPLKERIPTLEALADAPFIGITTDGKVVPGLFPLQPTGIPTTRIVDAANTFLDSLNHEQRASATRPLDTREWRLWHNAEMFIFRHGVLLESLSLSQLEAAYDVLRASLSAFGFETARNIMKLNEFLREITGFDESLGELLYFLTIFGTPSATEPWGWQIDGHHLNLSFVVVGDQITMTPAFMGGEPIYCDQGRFDGISVFDAEQRAGLELIHALSEAQRKKAILFPTMLSTELPTERSHPSEGRQWSTAFQDNAVIPYEGIPVSEFTAGQRDLLMSVIEAYVGYIRPGHSRVRLREIENRLDETNFAWIGGYGENDTYYYKVHSPLIMIEFDMHRGVFLDNEEPEKFHVHTMVRTPNGNDYGKDLLRQHLALHHKDGK
jgi:Protein of unknown function (DUF3500)